MIRRVAVVLFAGAFVVGVFAGPAGAQADGAGVDSTPPAEAGITVAEPTASEPEPPVALAPDTPVSDGDSVDGSRGPTDGSEPGVPADEIPADDGTVTDGPIDWYYQSVVDDSAGSGEPTDPQVAETGIMPVSVEDTSIDDDSRWVATIFAGVAVIVAAGGVALWVQRSRRTV